MPDDGITGLQYEAYQRWRTYIVWAFKDLAQEAWRTSLFISESVLRRSEYLPHFPHQVMRASPLQGSGVTQPLTPATCLHVYEYLAGLQLSKPFCVLTEGTCVRYEEGAWKPPYRLPAFTMMELVLVGEEPFITKAHEALLVRTPSFFKDALLSVTAMPATDAFFLGTSEGALRLQQIKGLKKEFVREGGQTALASLNLHEDYFGKHFDISANRAVAHSLCLAFGLERLAATSLEVWGEDITTWPTMALL